VGSENSKTLRNGAPGKRGGNMKGKIKNRWESHIFSSGDGKNRGGKNGRGGQERESWLTEPTKKNEKEGNRFKFNLGAVTTKVGMGANEGSWRGKKKKKPWGEVVGGSSEGGKGGTKKYGRRLYRMTSHQAQKPPFQGLPQIKAGGKDARRQKNTRSLPKEIVTVAGGAAQKEKEIKQKTQEGEAWSPLKKKKSNATNTQPRRHS